MSKLPTQHLTKCALTYIAEEAKLLPRNLRSKFVFLDSSMVERTAVNRDVVGSSPTRGVFLNMRLRGQAVKTSPFHGGNTGSIPVGVTHIRRHSQAVRRGSATP